MKQQEWERLIEDLEREKTLPDQEMIRLLETDEGDELLFRAADRVRRGIYGDEVYIRGLIEFTNYCKNNCYYCGIRRGNTHAHRYRLTKEQILDCCVQGYDLGFRTFVLQGGEDPWYTDERICEIVWEIRNHFPDCAVTLSIGEKERASYQAYYDAGANRYLLRHETADLQLYGKLHPSEMSFEHRRRCLYDLKEIGYQVGAGFMVGAPFQTMEHILEDLWFLRELQPDMIGIGPYITHHETPFADQPSGSFLLSVRLVAVLRLMFPYALIPATTALGTIHPQGREKGLQAGANVVMPNLSPQPVRKLYDLYENKISTGEEAAESRRLLEQRVKQAGYRVVTARGDVKKEK